MKDLSRITRLIEQTREAPLWKKGWQRSDVLPQWSDQAQHVERKIHHIQQSCDSIAHDPAQRSPRRSLIDGHGLPNVDLKQDGWIAVGKRGEALRGRRVGETNRRAALCGEKIRRRSRKGADGIGAIDAKRLMFDRVIQNNLT